MNYYSQIIAIVIIIFIHIIINFKVQIFNYCDIYRLKIIIR